MILEGAVGIVLKEATKEMTKKAMETAEGIMKKEVKSLPKQIGEFSEAKHLPYEIGESLETDRLPDEIGGWTEAERLPDEIGGRLETERLPDEIGGWTEAERLPDEIGDEMYSKVQGCLNDSQNSSNIKKINETDTLEKKGGSYRDVKKTSDGDTHEVHHIPAKSASKIEKDDGPAIKMEKGDHRQTASYGNSKEAQEYCKKQKELIEQGKFREALQMDIDDIHEKFGDKYDDAIAEMLDYVEQLEQEGKLDG